MQKLDLEMLRLIGKRINRMSKYKNALQENKKVLMAPIYLLLVMVSLCFPRNKRLWVFGSKFGFSDGPLAVMKMVRSENINVQCIWIAFTESDFDRARKEGVQVYHHNSLMAAWKTLRAGVIFASHGFGDIYRPFVPGSYFVQLWHGIPLTACPKPP